MIEYNITSGQNADWAYDRPFNVNADSISFSSKKDDEYIGYFEPATQKNPGTQDDFVNVIYDKENLKKSILFRQLYRT